MVKNLDRAIVLYSGEYSTGILQGVRHGTRKKRWQNHFRKIRFGERESCRLPTIQDNLDGELSLGTGWNDCFISV